MWIKLPSGKYLDDDCIVGMTDRKLCFANGKHWDLEVEDYKYLSDWMDAMVDAEEPSLDGDDLDFVADSEAIEGDNQ